MGPRARWLGRDATEKKRKGEADTIPHILRRDHPPPVANVRERERERPREREEEWTKQRAKARREESFTVYDTTRFLGIPPQFREPILQLQPSLQIYRTSLLSVRLFSSILPAARYRLPNNLTDCSAHRLPARYPCPGFLPKPLRISCDPYLDGKERRGGTRRRFVERIVRIFSTCTRICNRV